MAIYFIKFDGAEEYERQVEHPSIAEARNDAVAMLGGYLQEHPEFAYERHWRVDLFDESRRLLLHVIVATVDAPKPLNWASFDA